MERVPDEQILLKMGLTDQEIRDMENKFAGLANTLDRSQREALKESMPTAEAAAKTIGPDVTAERLMEFIRARAPKDAPMFMIFNGIGATGGGHHHY
jgi:hypothetical protein